MASVGYLLGSIKIGNISLGVAAVLFTGLFFGALDEKLEIPKVIFTLGLILFVYSIGLSSGKAFFQSYKKNGLRDFFFILGMLIISGAIAFVLALLFGLSPADITGIYAGSTTNTPALAGVLDYVQLNNPAAEAQALSESLVVGYSFSYPMGVLGGIIAIIVMEKLLKIDYNKEKQALKKIYPLGDDLTTRSIKVLESSSYAGKFVRDFLNNENLDVVFSRTIKGDQTTLANYDTVLEPGIELLVVGNLEDLEQVIQLLGEHAESALTYNRSKFDVRRIFVSNPDVVGKSISSLDINKKYNAVISRIRRGDVDMLAKGDTVLEQGDRIRFIAKRSDLKSLADLFGDSYAASSKVNLFSFGLGIGIGLILGSLKLGFSDSFSFQLGTAGGPLVVGLILGALGRTGPIIWALPYSANVTLQQIGLILLLASVGVSSGHTFVDSFNSEAILFIGLSAVISILTAFITIWLGYKLIKIPFSILLGIVSNQPAILDFANTRADNGLPSIGYTMVFPIALICKIIIAQILFILVNLS